jgi:DNA-binding MarR family transcriptional regulator
MQVFVGVKMEQASDDPALRAWRAMLRAQRRVSRALDADLSRKGGLPLRAYEVLSRLSRAPGCAMRMSDLASSVLLSASGITRLVDQLVDRALIERRPDPSDARATIAALTRDGKSILRKTGGIYSEGVKKHFDLEEPELLAIAESLERLVERGEPPARARERRPKSGG